MSLDQLSQLRPFIEGPDGIVLREFVAPCVSRSIRYDRISNYSTAQALTAVGSEFRGIAIKGGRGRLVLGDDSAPQELVLAARGGEPAKQELADYVRNRIVGEVAHLSDAYAKGRIAALARMVQDNQLEVRIAFPLTVGPGLVFNTRRMIFTDEAGATAAGVASPNETFAGLRRNFEEVAVHLSWIDPSGHVPSLIESFERTWTDHRDDLLVMSLGGDLADQILEACGFPPRPDQLANPFPAVLDAARRSPALWPVNIGNAALYPHQERAVRDALSRWPVRVLLADEVGLGKTLEAGAVISYALRHGLTEDCVVVAPKNLLQQWADELRAHFDLDAWVFDSARRIFKHDDGREIAAATNFLGADRPQVCVVSLDYVRGTRSSGHRLSGDSLPGMLVVDEAHRARIRFDQQGHRRPTLVARMLEDVGPKIPHLLLLTATPMQMDAREYHGILGLLGLPDHWKDERHYLKSLEILASSQSDRPPLQLAADALTLIASSAEFFGANRAGLSHRHRRLLDRILDDPRSAQLRVDAVETWADVVQLLLLAHPANRLTIRNSRSTLESLGYSFPDREFSAPVLDVDHRINAVYERVDVYLADAYGRTEEAAGVTNRGRGFSSSTYRQRMASSLAACRATMLNRLATIDSHLDPGEGTVTEAVRSAAEGERMYVTDVLTAIEVVSDAGLPDPKLEQMVIELSERDSSGRTLVFSRYTATVRACIERWKQEEVEGGIACYTGSDVWIETGGSRFAASKVEVQDALRTGRVGVVFCSDAASEGLNFQSAGHLINVDVPWSPARLEQRIGRIARLGQRRPVVNITNLWYPNSVEARMYSRLLHRHDLYQVAVGEFPEIVAECIAAEVSESLGGSAANAPDAIDRLNDARASQQLVAILRVWDARASSVGSSDAVRRELVELLLQSDPGFGESVYDVEAGSRLPISLRSPELDYLEAASDVSGCEFFALNSDARAFRVRDDDGNHDIPPSKIVDVLAASLGLPNELAEYGGDGPNLGAWMPDHTETTFGSQWPSNDTRSELYWIELVGQSNES